VKLTTKQYRVKGENVALFIKSRFLLLPLSEVKLEKTHLEVSEESLDAALDVTPDLPPRVLGLAWKQNVLFSTQVSPVWAKDVAKAAKLSATGIIKAFQEV